MLHQVDAIGLQALQRFLDLFGCQRTGPPVDFRHQKHFVAVSVAQCLAHSIFAVAVVIIPAVVHEVDAAIDGPANDADSLLLILGHADMKSSQANGGDLLARAAQHTVDHLSRLRFRSQRLRAQGNSRAHDGLHEIASGDATATVGERFGVAFVVEIPVIE